MSLRAQTFAAAALLAAAAFAASPTAILSRDERIVADGDTPAKLAFVQRIAIASADFDAAVPVVSPPEWGKTISDATGGKLAYHRSFEGGFFGHLALDGLEPNHAYLLAFNGKPGLKGNELLRDAVPGLPDERYYDFLDIVSDEQGRYEATLAVKLAPGKYHVRLYVKDTSDWKIALYHDYFEFEVKPIAP